MKGLTVFVAIVALAVTGCASTMTINQQAVTVGGRTVHYVFAESSNETGMNFTVADRYDENGNLMARDAAHNNGIMQAVVPALISGAATAGGMIGAASVLRPAQTTVTQTGGSVESSSTGGDATTSAMAAGGSAINKASTNSMSLSSSDARSSSSSSVSSVRMPHPRPFPHCDSE